MGYAEQLEFAGGSFDLVLNMGPMYHLTQRASRLEALRKIHYVLKPAGLLCSTYIPRFASLLDGYREGYIKDPVFVNLIREDLKSGMHNPDPESTNYFTEAYFHHPLEVEAELSAAGFGQHRMFAVEGFYSPKWSCTHYTLLELMGVGIDPQNQKYRESARMILGCKLGQEGGINYARTVKYSD